ncbi:MAG: response regulator [Salibacteraceae bacterium]
MSHKNPILLVEDDLVDAMTVNRALREIQVENDVVHVKNGEEALHHLLEENNETPCITLLDLNMPKMNGIEFLRERLKHERLRLVPTIVLTTSKDNYDKLESYKLGIAGYMVKPIDFKEFVDLMRTLTTYWSKSEYAEPQ